MTPDAVHILIATANPGKAREIQAVLNERPSDSTGGHPLRGIVWHTLVDRCGGVAEPEEDGATFLDNAILKARYYSLAAGLWTLADDSGLEVDALAGAPGVLSARFADAPEGSPREARDAANNRKLIGLLRDVPMQRRTARFRCVLALADGDRVLATAEGSIEGLIIDEPRGAGGFGYDPHFWLPGLEKTTAELSPEHKNRISHRGTALRALKEKLAALVASA